MRRIILLIVMLFFFDSVYVRSSILAIDSTDAKKASFKEEYELQERCGKRAQEVFTMWSENTKATNIGMPADNRWKGQYINHYNKKLNKCFYLLIENTVTFGNSIKTLYDINDNRIIGRLNLHLYNKTDPVYHCSVSGKDCHSEAEWNALIKPYMEE